jgi:hypothetical protein
MPKLGVVIFGASKYDNHRELNNPRFAHSAQQFLKTISDPEIVPDCIVSSLDLYDEPYRPGETLEKITDFVSRDFDIVIVYYCGHGDVALKAREYRVFLRKSKKNLRATTMLDVNGLINDVEGISTQKTVYFVLDACFSGAAIQEFMDAGGTEALIDRSLSQTITQRGVAIFAATSGNDVALTKKGDKLSLFTGAFVRCLNEGIPYKPDVNKLSWLEVRDEIARSTRDRLGPDAPVPKIMSADEKFGDVTRAPFFLNRAYASSKTPGATTEELYWRNLPDDPPLSVLHDFLTRFPNGVFAALARALADKRISRSSESELEEHLGFYPKTKFKQQIAVRLTTLKRERIQNSTDIAALEQIAAENPELADEARYRIDFIRRELAEAEAWARVKTSSIKADLEQFLEVYPDGRFSKLAMARLAELSVTPNDDRSWRASLLGWIHRSTPSFKENWRRYAAAVAFLTLCAAGALLIAGGNSSTNIQAFRQDFAAAGDDPVKLRAFISHCAVASCPLEQEARDHLRKAEEAARNKQIVEAALDAAGIDLAQLRRFVQQCDATSCAVAQEAHERLVKAEEVARRAQIVEAALDAAGIDLGQLRRFVQQCDATSCGVAQEARNRLAKAETAERARLAQIAEADRTALAAARNDLGKLRTFVQQCNANSCTVAQEARDLLVKAEAAETARLARIAEDRKTLDTAKGNLGQLRSFVQQCNANSCTVAQEARDLLVKAEAAETARLARIAEDRKTLDTAKGNLGQLRTFVQQCNANSCTVAQEARDLLVKAEAAETARLAQIAEADRTALGAARNDLGKLRTFVQQCNANSCSVAQDARDLLAKSEASAKNKLIGFNTFLNYDISQNDIEIIFDKSYADCNSKCESTNGCVAFVFNKWKNACFLKSMVGPLLQDPRSDAVVRKDQAWPVLATTKIGTCPYYKSSMIGAVSRSFASQSAANCQSQCEANQGCVAYTFRKADRNCSFFSSVSDRTRDDPTADSGSRMQNPC